MEQRSSEVCVQALPFVTYPTGDLRTSIWSGSNCRRGYGLKFIEKTKQTCCVYCGMPIATDYYAWLTMVIDHVVPVSVCVALRIPMEFCRSLANMALACAACNGFDNRYTSALEPRDWSFEEFLNLRDEIFITRKDRILMKQKEEREFFDQTVAHPSRAGAGAGAGIEASAS